MTETSMRVTVDRDMCMGSGNCVWRASGVFDQSPDDGLVVVLVDAPAPDQHEAVRQAVDECPTAAITLIEGES